jgi:hypothetical protein
MVRVLLAVMHPLLRAALVEYLGAQTSAGDGGAIKSFYTEIGDRERSPSPLWAFPGVPASIPVNTPSPNRTKAMVAG